MNTLYLSLLAALAAGLFCAKQISVCRFNSSKSDDAGSSFDNPRRNLEEVRYFAGVTIVGTVDAVRENGVMIAFVVGSCYYVGFAPFSEFRDQELAQEDLISRKLRFSLVYSDQVEAYLSVLGPDEPRRESDWPVSIWT